MEEAFLDLRVGNLMQDLDRFSSNWSISPVVSEADQIALLELWEQFEQYHGPISNGNRERVVERETAKIESKRFQYFLVRDKEGRAVAYYSTEYPCAKHPGSIKLDQVFVERDARGKGIAYFIIMHLMKRAASELCKGDTREIISYHFRKNGNPEYNESLEKITRILDRFGFKYMPEHAQECPKSVRSLDSSTYKFLHLPI